ncbi:MAG: hypothetical protein DI586_01175 [Micavibrio aeruginosavorus]|uniref:branched-chain-amino-acid transaminase n=1 Tax=Micavibrio aeruginosavorus TaxID=349221 RepID=A0A2W5FQI0_9BACT|nr:MAG: hypothetical protein DI586_01175 [Micavibrio aeruginosavorus]
MFCFFHDQFIEEEKVSVSMNDRGFTLGDGVFDTQVTTEGVLLDADLHFERLLNDAIILGIPFDKTILDLNTISTMLLARNSISTGRWVVRTQITRGIGLRGLTPPKDAHPTLVMRATPAPQIDDTPARAIIATTTRRNEHSPLSRIKSTNYGDNMLSLLEAQDYGAEDAILLNTEGHAACATTANIFIVENGIWITPPVSDGALPGITRMKLIAEHRAREEHITPERLQAAQEIYKSNSVIGLRKIILPI